MTLRRTHLIQLLICLPLILCSFDDNEIIGHPDILCQADTIDMQFKTRKPFGGKVYVKGNYNRPECRVDYGKKSADGRPVGGIRLNHGACNMDRQRMITPDGMMFSTILIISFHPLFVTKMDKAYNIKCMYREAVRTVEANIDVSMLPTETVQSDLPMPTCSYTIRKDQLDGEILKYARVGDQVVHRWQCDSEEYGLLVHSCFVEDGQGEKQLIVDEHGCHTDRLLLGDPTYVEALNMAYRESFVFKFADRVAVRFQCEIRLCLKEDGGCDGVTPPMCIQSNIIHDDAPIVRDADNSTVLNNSNASNATRRARRSLGTKDADLISQTFYVMDSETEDTKEAQASSLPSQRVCLSQRGLLLTASVLTTVLVTFVSAVIVVIYRRYKRLTVAINKEQSDYY